MNALNRAGASSPHAPIWIEIDDRAIIPTRIIQPGAPPFPQWGAPFFAGCPPFPDLGCPILCGFIAKGGMALKPILFAAKLISKAGRVPHSTSAGSIVEKLRLTSQGVPHTSSLVWELFQSIKGELASLRKLKTLVRPERFELPAYSFGGCRSIQLSYGRTSGSNFHRIYQPRSQFPSAGIMIA